MRPRCKIDADDDEGSHDTTQPSDWLAASAVVLARMSSAESTASGFSAAAAEMSAAAETFLPTVSVMEVLALMLWLLLLWFIGFEVIGFGEDSERLNIGGRELGDFSSELLPGDNFRNWQKNHSDYESDEVNKMPARLLAKKLGLHPLETILTDLLKTTVSFLPSTV